MNTFPVVMIAAFALVAGACGDDDEMLVLTDTDSGADVEVDGGERFVLRLASNPSTGYAWEIDAMSTPGLAELRSHSFIQDAGTDVVGAAGVEVFEFEAGSDGAGILRLSYVRSFEDPPVPDRVAEYIVRIDGAEWPPDDLPEPPDTSSATAPVEIGVLVEGGAADAVVVSGFVVWDDEQARFCSVLAESYPPQCQGDRITIANPDDLEVALEEAQGVRWTQSRVDLTGSFDGTALTVGD